MKCARCGKRMLRAAALSNGLPVGPACAVALGLLAPKPAAPSVSVARPDEFTLDLFDLTHKPTGDV